MSATIPGSHRDLIDEKKAVASLATVMADGSPQVTPVWFDVADGNFRVNTARGRIKDRNMRRTPRVALMVMDPDNPYRYLAVRGRVVGVTEEGAEAHIDALAKKYLGQERYPYRRPGEVRVMYRIAPERVTAQG